MSSRRVMRLEFTKRDLLEIADGTVQRLGNAKREQCAVYVAPTLAGDVASSIRTFLRAACHRRRRRGYPIDAFRV